MTISVDVANEHGRLAIGKALVAQIVRTVVEAERVRHAMISVTFLRNHAMAALNRKHLGQRGPTDVVSFGFAPAGKGQPVIGDIYIAPDVARENAAANGAGVREELARLLVHGTLHVLGYDHPDPPEERVRSRMWARQERLLDRALERGRA
jgi:probable rRNA maturation factor